MAKFKVNQIVVRKSDGKNGIIRAREVNTVGNRTEVKYLVDFGEGIENWQVVKRCDISPKLFDVRNPYIIKTYEVGDGKVITMAAMVSNEKNHLTLDDMEYFKINIKSLTIGFSLYNGTDDYDAALGEKYAIHRCKKNPFATMYSYFSGEFNYETVTAIMDAKAKYIINNIDRFYRPDSK